MLSDIQRAALRAAAKLAFSATIIGCGSASPVDPAAGEPGADEETAATTSEVSDKLVLRRPRRDAGTLDEACCKETVAKAFPDGGTPPPRWSPNPAPNMPPAVTACCQVLANAADARMMTNDPGAWDWPERDTCCAVIGWNAAATCTPWGPPVPPAMRRVVNNLGVA